ncbi:MAG: radical SAM protein [Anaerolineales bacterium]|nr:radical SAM protein [Anaerolineales bacterium]
MSDLLTWALKSQTPTTPKAEWARVNADGHLVLPPEVVAQLGLRPGAEVRLETLQNGLRLHRPVTHLAKVYIEPTIDCNLDCVTCFRHGWDEPLGRMSDETFAAILAGLRELDPLPTIYFGGIGEPLFHKRTVEWIAAAKALGARVEMITNGTLLTERRGQQLMEAGLDLLWVSIDGASPESYADVRLGAELPRVLENLSRFRKLRKGGHFAKPEIGVAFVAMKRNIADLPKVLKLSRELGARHFNVSNVLPVTEDLQQEMLYTGALRDLTYLPAREVPRLSLPKMDFNALTRDALIQAFQSGFSVNYAGHSWGGANDVCNYIESGTMSIAWNGDVSPCWPLMHTHQSYLHAKPRLNKSHVIGNVRDRSVSALWLDPGYVAYRQKVQSFGFAPCTFCGGCDLSESNEEDCYANAFPACGGCLWSQGVIQCP